MQISRPHSSVDPRILGPYRSLHVNTFGGFWAVGVHKLFIICSGITGLVVWWWLLPLNFGDVYWGNTGNSVGSCWIVLPMFKQHIQKVRKHVPECRPNNAIIPNLILPQLVWWEKNMKSLDWCILDIYESLLRFQTSGTRCRSCSLKIRGGWLVVSPQERSCGCSQHHWHPYTGHSNAWRDPSTWRHSPTRGRSVGTSVFTLTERP